MTDYETDFVGWDEVPGHLSTEGLNRLNEYLPESHPQTDALVTSETLEEPPRYGTNETMKGMVLSKYAEPEEVEEEFYGQEEEGEEDYDEEGEDEEGGEEEYGDYGDEEEEAEEWPSKRIIPSIPMEDRFFRAGESLQGKYSEVEIESFMKLLGVRPRTQWQDQSVYHHKLGIHVYEDEAQEMDPDFHLLSESERKEADKQTTKKFRSGSEIKLVVDGREPITPNYRF